MPTDVVDRDELARGGMPLVGYCVTGVAARVPRHVRHDELVSAGLLGLAQAARSWDPARGVSFEHYARRRIEGAILDELRGRDWSSRSARQHGRQLRVATEELTSALGRAPADQELADRLGVSIVDVQRIRDDVDRAVVLHLDALPGEGVVGTSAGAAEDPAQQVLAYEMRGYLHDAVLALPDRLRKVMVEYFFEERPMQDIADDLGVTISRVSQLRAQALELMRSGLGAQFDDQQPVEPRTRAERKRSQYAAAIAASSTPAARVSASAAGVLVRMASAG
jgi:RNA polymerase sigma factor for flagellar operon FliA